MSTVDPTTVAPAVPVIGAPTKRWTREEYYRLADEGFFDGQRVELIGGQIVVMSPQSYPHYFSSDGITELLKTVFGSGYWVRHQAPLSIPKDGEPEPDVSVVTGSRFDYADHPQTARLVVEVAKTSLDFDTHTKPYLYASAAIPEYWVLDLIHRQLIVYRQPEADSKSSFGSKYSRVETVSEDGTISPLDKPEASLLVRDMLPPEA